MRPTLLLIPLLACGFAPGCEKRDSSGGATTRTAPADVPQVHRPIGIDRNNPELKERGVVPPPSNAPESKALPTTSPTSGPAAITRPPAAP